MCASKTGRREMFGRWDGCAKRRVLSRPGCDRPSSSIRSWADSRGRVGLSFQNLQCPSGLSEQKTRLGTKITSNPVLLLLDLLYFPSHPYHSPRSTRHSLTTSRHPLHSTLRLSLPLPSSLLSDLLTYAAHPPPSPSLPPPPPIFHAGNAPQPPSHRRSFSIKTPSLVLLRLRRVDSHITTPPRISARSLQLLGLQAVLLFSVRLSAPDLASLGRISLLPPFCPQSRRCLLTLGADIQILLQSLPVLSSHSVVVRRLKGRVRIRRSPRFSDPFIYCCPRMGAGCWSRSLVRAFLCAVLDSFSPPLSSSSSS